MNERLTVTFSVPSPASKHLDLNISLQRQCLTYQAVMITIQKLPEEVLFLVSHVGVSVNNHHDEHTIKFVLKGHTTLTSKWEEETDTRVNFIFTPEITLRELCDRIYKSILSKLKERLKLTESHQYEMSGLVKKME